MMFEARLPIEVPVSEDLCEFIRGYFKQGGPQECQIQDIEEYALSWGRPDIFTAMTTLRAEYGNLWLRREFWT